MSITDGGLLASVHFLGYWLGAVFATKIPARNGIENIGLPIADRISIHAAMRADATLDKGDLDGYATWKRILRGVEELRRAGPGAGLH